MWGPGRHHKKLPCNMVREMRRAERQKKRLQQARSKPKVKQEQESEETVSRDPSADAVFIKVEPVDDGYAESFTRTETQNFYTTYTTRIAHTNNSVEPSLRHCAASVSRDASACYDHTDDRYPNADSNDFSTGGNTVPVVVKVEPGLQEDSNADFTVPRLQARNSHSNQSHSSCARENTAVRVRVEGEVTAGVFAVPEFCVKSERDDSEDDVKQRYDESSSRYESSPAASTSVRYSLRTRDVYINNSRPSCTCACTGRLHLGRL